VRLGEQTLIRIFAKHEPYTDGHLGEVLEQMKKLGAPTIEVVEWRGDYFAVEGSHRLAAAHELGLAPTLIVSVPDLLEPEAEAFWEQVKQALPHYSWLLNDLGRAL
jgi:hypothetical protein